MDRQSVFTVVLTHIVRYWLPMMEVRKSARTWHDKGQQFMISCLARPYFLLHIGSTTNSSVKLLSHFQRTTGQISDSTVWVVTSKLEKRKILHELAKRIWRNGNEMSQLTISQLDNRTDRTGLIWGRENQSLIWRKDSAKVLPIFL